MMWYNYKSLSYPVTWCYIIQSRCLYRTVGAFSGWCRDDWFDQSMACMFCFVVFLAPPTCPVYCSWHSDRNDSQIQNCNGNKNLMWFLLPFRNILYHAVWLKNSNRDPLRTNSNPLHRQTYTHIKWTPVCSMSRTVAVSHSCCVGTVEISRASTHTASPTLRYQSS